LRGSAYRAFIRPEAPLDLPGLVIAAVLVCVRT
jgi:hypothetical protein